MTQNAIVVATPKQDIRLILSQSDAILELKKRMKKGVHYGAPYPGSDKETLLKPGAEWLAKRFGLRSHYEEITRQIDIDFDRPWHTFIMFEYRCTMIDIETGVAVAEAIGFANSREDKYAWRWVAEADIPPGIDHGTLVTKNGTLSEFAFAIEKGETSGQYGKPAEYWQAFRDAIQDGTARHTTRKTRKGTEMEAWEIGGTLYRVPHENPLDLLNTLSKMCQKRAKVSSVMEATGASSYFAPGDDEVTDIYVPEDDIGVVDAEFEVVIGEPQVSPSQPSAAVRGAGIPARPQPQPEPPPDFMLEEPDMPLNEHPQASDGDPDIYHCDMLTITKSRTATSYALRIIGKPKAVMVNDPTLLEPLRINGTPVLELEAGKSYELSPTWTVRANYSKSGWEVLSIDAGIPVSGVAE